MKKHVHVVGAVIHSENRILCAQRGPSGSLPHMWEFPGGKIDLDETPREALVREIAEELGCGVRVGQEVLTTTYEYDFAVVNLTTFYCELLEGNPELTVHSEMQWLSVEDLHTLDWAPADIPTVDVLRSAASGS